MPKQGLPFGASASMLGKHKIYNVSCSSDPQVVYTVPANKVVHLKIVACITDATPVSASVACYSGAYPVYVLSHAATASTVFVSSPLDIWLEVGDYVMWDGSAADAGEYCSVAYDEYDLKFGGN